MRLTTRMERAAGGRSQVKRTRPELRLHGRGHRAPPRRGEPLRRRPAARRRRRPHRRDRAAPPPRLATARRPGAGELAAWTSQANEDWRPVYEDLTSADKQAILEALSREQGYLCGYCGSRVDAVGGDAHIEHVIAQEECKRTGRRHLVTDYGNLLGSCMGTDERSRVPKHCGHARGTKPVPVTPHQPDCGTYFVFRSNGGVEASTHPARRGSAEETIRNLGLHVSKLKAARAAAIGGALAGLDALPSDAGHLVQFCFAIRQVLLRNA